MKRKGFTLIELMIVVAIIAILAAAALPAFGAQIKKAKDSKAVGMVANMRSQLSMVVADLEGMHPAASEWPNVINGGTIIGVNSIGFNSTIHEIQGAEAAHTSGGWPAANSGTLKAGTPASGSTYAYNVDGDGTTGNVMFTTAGNDTKGRNWTDY